MELKSYINEMIQETGSSKTMDEIVSFFVDNEWFGKNPNKDDMLFSVSDEHMNLYTTPLKQFLLSDSTINYDALFEMFEIRYPMTADQWKKFTVDVPTNVDERFYIIDFLLYRLQKEVFLYRDPEVEDLIRMATNDMIKAHGDLLTFFLSWLKANTKTAYSKEYIMSSRISMKINNQAYDFDEYLELLYYLYNESYILENEMYEQAARSKNYTDTWLFLSLHFICALRTTDMVRLYHPTLPYEPERVLKDIEAGDFRDEDALTVLLSITYRLCILPLKPNKTSAYEGIPSIKFTVPESCQVHIGKLFALAEAHRLITGDPDDTPLIRRITSYDQISRYMGDEIGSLFLEANFRTRSANKSYLQAIFLLTDDILGNSDDDVHMQGYMLAALARSHKSGFGEYAKTTATYLKDCKLSGMTAEVVARELFERGVLSFIPSMLLKIVTGNEYSKLSVSKQTEMIKTLNLTPFEIESTVSIVEDKRKQAEQLLADISQEFSDKKELINILHRIGNGSAFSKNPENMCFLSAMKKLCPYDERKVCIGCPYEIATKSTFFLMLNEYNRMYSLYQSAAAIQLDTESRNLEREKYKHIVQKLLLPQINEMLQTIKQDYGEEAYNIYYTILKENTV